MKMYPCKFNGVFLAIEDFLVGTLNGNNMNSY